MTLLDADDGNYWLDLDGPDGLVTMIGRWNSQTQQVTLLEDGGTIWPYWKVTNTIHKWRVVKFEPVIRVSTRPRDDLGA